MYRAPEMVDLYRNQEVGEKVDVWALGCILYSLCYIDHPFAEESSLQILNAAYTIPSAPPHPPRIHRLIRALLEPDPAIRPPAAHVLAAVQKLQCPTPATPISAIANASQDSGPQSQSAASSGTSACRPHTSTFTSAFEATDFGADFESTSQNDAETRRHRTLTEHLVQLTITARDAEVACHRAPCLVRVRIGAAICREAQPEMPTTAGADTSWQANFSEAQEDFRASFESDSSPPAVQMPPAPLPETPTAVGNSDSLAGLSGAVADEDEFGEFNASSPGIASPDGEPGVDDDFGTFQASPVPSAVANVDESNSSGLSAPATAESSQLRATPFQHDLD